jgi:cell wall-associated NlpC family hydrolase
MQVHPESPYARGDDIEGMGTPGEALEWQAVEPAGEAVVSFAKGFLGCRYVYGASGPRYFDCSGFTMYVMGKFGIKLPHSASAQSLYGTGVSSREGLMLGDLVFFNTVGPRRIGHVGIYIGDGKFIHAGSRGVAVNSLDDAYYQKRYMVGTRLLK